MIFKSILEKVKNFENSYLKNQKEKILEKLIKKETSNSSSNWYIIHCVIMGVVLANLFNNIFLSGMVGFWSILLSLIYIVSGSSFIFAYLKRNKTKEEVIERIINEKTIRNLNSYMNELNSKYLYSGLIFENEEKNFKEINENLTKISIKEIKTLLCSLSEDEISTVKELLKEHINKEYMSLDVIYSLTVKCEKEIEEVEREENFINALTSEEKEEKDLLDLMIDKCNLVKKEKINFKEAL